MFGDLLTAVTVGLSFGNLWVCVVLVLALEKTSHLASAGFLAGRTGAVLVLSVALSLLSPLIRIENYLLNIISGLLLLCFVANLALQHILNIVPPWKKKRTSGHNQHQCDSNCSTCPAGEKPSYKELCGSCSDHSICLAEEHKIAPDSTSHVNDTHRSGFFTSSYAAGFIMGALRGAAVCSKLLLLAPVLLRSSPVKAAAVGLLFSLASSIYPFLGFIAGSFALKLVKYKKILFSVSCLVLSGIGIHYIILGFLIVTGR